MGSFAQYWRLVRIDASGQRRVEEIEAAKTFFQEQFGALVEQSCLSDALIQQKLVSLSLLNHSTTEDSTLARYCLRCFVSQQIERVCVQLELKFGSQHGFSRQDLFPFVLTDQGHRRFNQQSDTLYRPFSMEIIESFEADRSELATWTIRQVRHHRELNRFLQERGVYLITDWAILNDTRSTQLRRILSEFYHLTAFEIKQACSILDAYHQIYREFWRQQSLVGRRNKKEKCPKPTDEQLRQMAEFLNKESNLALSSREVLRKLQSLASQLRQYRIYRRGGSLPTDSFDQPETRLAVESVKAPEQDEDQEVNEFLTFYREQFSQCLDRAITQAIDDRCTYLQGKTGKKRDRAERFLTALRLLHCDGLMMAEIAAQLGLEAQYQVSQLVKLKEFRGLVRQKLLSLLSLSVLDKARFYANSSQLHKLDAQLEVALEGQISEMIDLAEKEMFLGKRSEPPSSLFARRVCASLCQH